MVTRSEKFDPGKEHLETFRIDYEVDINEKDA